MFFYTTMYGYFYNLNMVWLIEYSSMDSVLFTKLYYQTVIVNKMGEQYKKIKYSLIILFIVYYATAYPFVKKGSN